MCFLLGLAKGFQSYGIFFRFSLWPLFEILIMASSLWHLLFFVLICIAWFVYFYLQVLQDRVEALNKQIQDLDGKSQSLQLTIDRLSSALTRTEDEECQQKDKVNKLLVSGYHFT